VDPSVTRKSLRLPTFITWQWFSPVSGISGIEIFFLIFPDWDGFFYDQLMSFF